MQNENTHQWYDFPQFYDLGFRDETEREVGFLKEAFERYGSRPVKRILEPGCGTGRLVIALAKAGYEVSGFDLNDRALKYLKHQLNLRKLEANVFHHDMTSFACAKKFDVVLNTFNTFRHLATEREALSHLQSVARCLRVGGLFFLGLHVMPPDADWKCTERWQAETKRFHVFFTLRVLKWELAKRLEILRVNMLIRDKQKPLERPTRTRTEMTLRIYRLKQLLTLIRKIPELKIEQSFDFWYDIDDPVKLDSTVSDLVLVIRRI
ncbi:MAG: class I SAM-dependent methyltransferase [Planctomycetales bacterium]|nr:class I SAM-dependent methyltransferase [Planctomycetales bacterium]